MLKPVKQRKRPTNLNQLADHSVKLSAQDLPPRLEPAKPVSLSEYMSAMGRKGGEIGGKRRMATMTAKERHEIAQKAAKARWKKAK
jgi:hypothetical protein